MPTPTTSSGVVSVKLTGDIRIDALMFGKRWVNSVITYSFPDNDSSWSTFNLTGYGPSSGDGEPWSAAFAPLSPSNQTYFNTALQHWANVAALQFSLVAESQSTVGDIRAAYSTVPDLADAEAWTYLPTGIAAGGDIWFNRTSNTAKVEWTLGSYSFLTAMHEIGHALGLTHPFENWLFPLSLDMMSFTIMSYSAIAGNQNSFLTFYPTTPMPLDILAIQHMYGVNKAYHHEDNHYYYDDSSTYHETIWDSGGSDWIEYGGQQAVVIDLREGQGSFIGTPVLAFDSINEYEVPNVWIAFGALIEHARGGQNDDLLIGNVHDNILIGGEGRDTLAGLEGNDYLYGEGGIDTAFYLGIRAHYGVNNTAEGFSVIDQVGVEGHDSLITIERLQFSDLGLALDMDGHAGQVAKFLGAVFGADSISNKEYVKVGLSLLDNGMSNDELALVALDATDARTHDEIVMLLWRNLFGENPTQDEKQPYLQALDSGEISIATLTVFAADTAINTSNINLVGLTQSGIEFAL